jgi:hypothetical protein
MFDGTDLSVAYGSSFDSPSSSMGGMGGGMNPHQSMMQNPTPTSVAEQANIPKSTASHQMPPDPTYNPPEAMYTKQTPAPQVYYNDSFWDRLANKKWEVFKLVVMALIIMLGLSLHDVANHYVSKYIGSAFLSVNQEAIVRVAYPSTIILFIWFIKALA